MKRLPIHQVKVDMEILVSVKGRFGFEAKPKTFTKHTVVNTSQGHPGKRTVYCKNGYMFTEGCQMYEYNKVNRTLMLLDDEYTVTDCDEELE